MRKILIIIVDILVLVGVCKIAISGIEIGNLEILGFKGIQDFDESIENKRGLLASLVSGKYQNAESTLNQTAKTLENTRDEYESATLLTASTGNSYITQSEKYEIEFLWTKLGNYAKDENIEIKINVTENTEYAAYDLNFTATGSYVGVTDFIYDIENDSKLGFKIENFAMVSDVAGVQATFKCTGININIDKSGLTPENTGTQNAETNANQNTNTTNVQANANQNTNTVNGQANTNQNANTTTSTQTNQNRAQVVNPTDDTDATGISNPQGISYN